MSSFERFEEEYTSYCFLFWDKANGLKEGMHMKRSRFGSNFYDEMLDCLNGEGVKQRGEWIPDCTSVRQNWPNYGFEESGKS